jgi:uncharacterized protein YggE
MNTLYKLVLPFITIIFFFLSLFIFIKLSGPIPFTVNSVTTTKTDTFSVTGDGTSNQKPDTAMITVGVQSDSTTVQQAQNDLNTEINKISQAIKNVGIDPKDIQTENYNVNPKYDYTSGQKITGYTANTNLAIKVRKIEDTNKVIDAATGNGATQVGGIQFQVADQQNAENEARQTAVANAKKKAEDAASIAGFKLGRIINYSENFGGTPVPLPMALGSIDAKQSIPTQVEPGSNEIKVTVTLSYQIL